MCILEMQWYTFARKSKKQCSLLVVSSFYLFKNAC